MGSPVVVSQIAALMVAAVAPMAVAQETQTTQFGGLLVRYDPAEWQIVRRDDGFLATCRAAGCAGRMVSGSTRRGEACTAEILRPPQFADARVDVFESDRLRWLVTLWWRGCRNAHPQSVAACTERDGVSYRIDAPLLTCRTAPATRAAASILDLIRNVSP